METLLALAPAADLARVVDLSDLSAADVVELVRCRTLANRATDIRLASLATTLLQEATLEIMADDSLPTFRPRSISRG